MDFERLFREKNVITSGIFTKLILNIETERELEVTVESFSDISSSEIKKFQDDIAQFFNLQKQINVIVKINKENINDETETKKVNSKIVNRLLELGCELLK